MRPAGRGPLESLYFDYPKFTCARAAELDGASPRHPVVIAGAGPIGMTAALTLARYGVRSILLDRKDTFNDGSRAICIARASMNIFDSLGVVQPFRDKALGWRYGRSYFGREQIYRLEMPHTDDEAYLPMYNLQQQYIEKFLHDAIAASPLIDMRWQSEVTGVAQSSDGATVTVTSPHGAYDLQADYVLAADGARSPIRSMLGLRLKGENYEGRYVIADIKMQHDFPTERRAFFEPPSNPDGTVLIHKQPDDIWRIDYQLRDGEDETDAIREDNIRARVTAILVDAGHRGPWDLEWWSIYTANTLCLDDYKHGRVVFIGDSAHIVPIFGVRGLNNGLADAHNIGWKLAYVLNGHADARLLESYSPERRGATLDVFANATKSTRFMTPPTRGWKLARSAALSLALRNDFARGLANPRQMQPYTYADSPLVTALGAAACTEGPAIGSAAPNVKLPDGNHLLHAAHNGGFRLLSFTASAADDAAGLALSTALSAYDPRLRTIWMGTDGRDHAAARIYAAEAGTVFLIRPDLHIAGRFHARDIDAIARTLRINLGHPPS